MNDFLLIIIVVGVSFVVFSVFVLVFNRIFGKRRVNFYLKKMRIKSERIINEKKAHLYAELQKKNKELIEKNKVFEEINKKKNVFLEEKEESLKKTIQESEQLKAKLKSEQEDCLIEREKLSRQREQIIKQLETIASISQEEAKDILFKNVEKHYTQQLNKLIKDKINTTKANLQEQTSQILATAIEGFSSQYVADKTISKIEIKDEETKGKIIGKEGRNIKSFEEESGVDIIIERDKPVISVSCFNPIRREVAVRALKKLIQDGRIQPQRIKDTLLAEEQKIKSIAEKVGQEAINELKITNIDPELVYHLGLLKFRTSYGQNVLSHSVEVAKIAGAMASELRLNDEIAIRAGLLHDIGKAKDYEVGLSHVALGVELAQKYQENEIVINAIHSHHDDVPKNNVYSVLVSAADTISAARPGARDNLKEDFLRRMETIERVCSQIAGVKKVHAIRSGRLIRVIVDSVNVSDFEAEKIANEIEIRLKKDLKIPGDAKIELIREFRTTRSI